MSITNNFGPDGKKKFRMAKRLVKIAKELNVGTTTIVEHLVKSGFEIENKPTAKVSDEMEQELLKEFQKSIAIKEQADKLVIGTRPVTLKKTKLSLFNLKPEPKVAVSHARTGT